MVEDKRAFPRVDLAFSVAIKTAGGKILKTTGRNVSRGGLQIEASAKVVRDLIPQEGSHRPKNMEPVVLSFALKLPDGQATVNARAKIVRLDRSADDKFILGFRFEAFGKGCYSILERFIGECLRY